MCGRFTLRTSAREIQRALRLAMPPDWSPRYNVAPTQEILAAIREPDPVQAYRGQADRAETDAVDAGPEGAASDLCPVALRAGRMRWGLIPAWADDPKVGLRAINARAETVAEKPTFRDAFARRRCLIVADGYYEWQTAGKAKQPYHIRPASGGLVLFAGLWERWRRPGEDAASPWLTATIVTREAIDDLKAYHDRMPAALSPEACAVWLDPRASRDDLLAAVESPRGIDWQGTPVSRRVGSAANDDPTCLDPPEGDVAHEKSPQRSPRA